jgi:hypothetical protein
MFIFYESIFPPIFRFGQSWQSLHRTLKECLVSKGSWPMVELLEGEEFKAMI